MAGGEAGRGGDGRGAKGEGVVADPEQSDGGQRNGVAARGVSMYMSSPVVAGGAVMGFSHLRRGQLLLLEAETGKVVWRGEPRSGKHATLVAWGDDVLVFQEDGGMVRGAG